MCCSIGQRKIFKDKQADGRADRYNDGTLMESHEYVSTCIETDKQRYRRTDRQTAIRTKIFEDKQADGRTDRHNDGTLIERHKFVGRCLHTERQTDKLTYGQGKIFKDTKANGWAGRQAH
jgi:hypothetical protein